MPKSLPDWLSYQESLHSKPIDLGLDRVRAVASALLLDRPARVCIVVGGTNGKGSTVAILNQIYLAAGYRVGTYTSPHLLRYNERIRINGVEIDDASLCNAFQRIEDARKDIPLTYFEFGTLAAFLLMQEQGLDVAVLEVGLGGRLDAVNIIDADVSIVTSVGIDHTEWLGSDRDSIGFEKAGIFRSGKPAICGDPDPPARLVEHAKQVQAALQTLHGDFSFAQSIHGWRWHGTRHQYKDLPKLPLAGIHQLQNASCALAAVEALEYIAPVSRTMIDAGLAQVQLAGRFQRFVGPIDLVLDVAHNADGVEVLVQTLKGSPVSGRTFAVFGMMARKDVAAAVRAMEDIIDGWCPVDLADPGATPRKELYNIIQRVYPHALLEDLPSVSAALSQALVDADQGDRVVVFGSFIAVAEALQWLSSQPAFVPFATERSDGIHA